MAFCSVLGSPLPGPTSREPGLTTRVRTYPYNPKKAKALLAEAGWKDNDGDGILDKDGNPFSFNIITNQGNEQRMKSAEIIQRRLRDRDRGQAPGDRVGGLSERIHQPGQFRCDDSRLDDSRARSL